MSLSSTTEVKCYWAPAAGAALQPGTITRRQLSANDVSINILYAGICHSDIHQARDEWKDVWGSGIFPMVPGHEIAGVVAAVGPNVTKFSVGQKVGVGCMVDSCRKCNNCRGGDEQYCSVSMVGTYNSKYRFPHCAEYTPEGGNPTYGGYSKLIVVDADFVLSIPDNLDFRATAPLLCAGITMYSPLMHYGLRPNQRYAVAGLGGLGHMGVKLGVAFGAHTTVISRGTSKKESALSELKAHAYVDSTNAAEMKAVAGSFDLIVSTIAADYDIEAYLNLLKVDGKLVVVGVPSNRVSAYLNPLIGGRRTLAGSLIGGIRETQDMLDFCGRHNIVCDVEVINAEQINEAYERTVKSDVKYRFVIDVSTI